MNPHPPSGHCLRGEQTIPVPLSPVPLIPPSPLTDSEEERKNGRSGGEEGEGEVEGMRIWLAPGGFASNLSSAPTLPLLRAPLTQARLFVHFGM